MKFYVEENVANGDNTTISKTEYATITLAYNACSGAKRIHVCRHEEGLPCSKLPKTHALIERMIYEVDP
jgi:hypothetical protein